MGARINLSNSSRNTMSIDNQDEEEDPEERVFESSTSSQNPGNIHYPLFNHVVNESTWGAAGSAYFVDNSRNEAQEMQAGDNVEYVSEDFSAELEGVNAFKLSNDSSPDTSDTKYVPSGRPLVHKLCDEQHIITVGHQACMMSVVTTRRRQLVSDI